MAAHALTRARALASRASVPRPSLARRVSAARTPSTRVKSGDDASSSNSASASSSTSSDARGGSSLHHGRVPWSAEACAIFWDLDNVRAPKGMELIWAYRLIEAAFEFADIAHLRAYAREGTIDEETRADLEEIGVTVTVCPKISEGSDVVLSTDCINFVRSGGILDASDDDDNEAARAVANAGSVGVVVVTRDEGMRGCVEFAKAQRGLCAGVTVCVDFLSKSMHRPQYANLLSSDGDVGVTEGYWTLANAIAKKSNKGLTGRGKLASSADCALMWDSSRLFSMPGVGAGDNWAGDIPDDIPELSLDDDEALGLTEEDGLFEEGDWDQPWTELDPNDAIVAAPGGVAAMWIDGKLFRWPPGTREDDFTIEIPDYS